MLYGCIHEFFTLIDAIGQDYCHTDHPFRFSASAVSIHIKLMFRLSSRIFHNSLQIFFQKWEEGWHVASRRSSEKAEKWQADDHAKEIQLSEKAGRAYGLDLAWRSGSP